ncbi:MAG: glucose-6-phosphate isomerase [bacterium]
MRITHPYTDTTWQKSMHLQFDYTNTLAKTIGNENGISEEDLHALETKGKDIDHKLKEERKNGKLPFFDLPYQDDLVKEIKEHTEELRQFENFVVIGIGGSALGPIATHTALNHPHYNALSKDGRHGCPTIFFPDNIDPDQLKGLLDIIDLKKTCFNIITKSGNTAETMANFMIIKQLLVEQLGNKNYAQNLIITTDPKKGVLREIAEKEDIKNFAIPKGVGGRFSIFTSVGLLPAAVTGIDISELLAGAAYMDKLCQESDIWRNPAYLNACLHYLADTKKEKSISVMMPYAFHLKDVADWYRQLWAESLGKKFSLNNQIINVGQTPIKALGATDQHSQVQLYMEGPNDKIITFLGVERYKSEVNIPKIYDNYESISYLGGHSLNELLKAEQQATEIALTKNQRPNCIITVPEINPFTIGALFYMFEVQTAFAGGLYNINPFDQPGVEEGKKATYALMGRKGYEEKRKELEKRLAVG